MVSEKIIEWLKQNKKFACANCQNRDYVLSDKFGIIYQVDFDAPQTLDTIPKRFQKLIVVMCKRCGKTELFDAHIAGFTDLLSS